MCSLLAIVTNILHFVFVQQQAYNATAVIRQMRHLVLASSSSRSTLGDDNSPSDSREIHPEPTALSTNGR